MNSTAPNAADAPLTTESVSRTNFAGARSSDMFYLAEEDVSTHEDIVCRRQPYPTREAAEQALKELESLPGYELCHYVVEIK